MNFTIEKLLYTKSKRFATNLILVILHRKKVLPRISLKNTNIFSDSKLLEVFATNFTKEHEFNLLK